MHTTKSLAFSKYFKTCVLLTERNMASRPILTRLFLTSLTFGLFRVIWNICRYIKWVIDGTQAQISRGKKAEYFAVSAQALTIKAKYNLTPIVFPASLDHFILAHHSFVNPEYVLQDNVSLYSHTDKEVVFVEVPPEVEEWRLHVSPFHKEGQYNNAIRIIVMPKSSFYNLANQLAKIPQPKIVFGYAMARSGSTLMCSIFESSGSCVAYSEPAILTDPYLIPKKCQSRDEEEAWKTMLIASVRILCKPRSYPVKVFFCKLFPGHYKLNLSTCVSTLREHFTDVHFLFLYRNGIDCVKSALKLREQLDVIRMVDCVAKVVPEVIQLKLHLLDVVTAEEKEKYTGLISVLQTYLNHPQFLYLQSGYMWASNLAKYQHFVSDHPSIMRSVKYEVLVKHPRDVISAIFTHIGLTQDLVDKAMTAMVNDSQTNCALSRKNLERIRIAEPCSEIRSLLSKICEEFGVPDIYDDCRVSSVNNS